MAIDKNALIREISSLCLTVKQAAIGTGWFPLEKGNPFTSDDPIEALERYCDLNSRLTNLTPFLAAEQFVEMCT